MFSTCNSGLCHISKCGLFVCCFIFDVPVRWMCYEIDQTTLLGCQIVLIFDVFSSFPGALNQTKALFK